MALTKMSFTSTGIYECLFCNLKIPLERIGLTAYNSQNLWSLDLKFRFIPTSDILLVSTDKSTWGISCGQVLVPTLLRQPGKKRCFWTFRGDSDVSPVIPSSMVRSLMMRLFEIHPAFHRYRAACRHFVNSSRKRMLCGLGMLGHPVHRTKNPGFKNQRHAGCLRNRASW